MGSRRKAREVAVKVIYLADTTGKSRDEAWEMAGQSCPGKEKEFGKKLAYGVFDELEFVDELIKKHAKNWSPERIAAVDKAIMRLALYEIYFKENIPKIVSINEAVELAKKYSTANSHRFVNGIIDSASSGRKNKKTVDNPENE